MKLLYCHICGGKLIANEDYFVCTDCEQKIYLNPKPCVELVLFNEKGQILLSKRGEEPYKDRYDLPGGFVDIGDNSLEEALQREMTEELGIDITKIKDLEYALSYCADYPWGQDNYKNIIMAFVGTYDQQKLTAHDDIELVEWFSPQDIKADFLSFAGLKSILDSLVDYNDKRRKQC